MNTPSYIEQHPNKGNPPSPPEAAVGQTKPRQSYGSCGCSRRHTDRSGPVNMSATPVDLASAHQQGAGGVADVSQQVAGLRQGLCGAEVG